MTFAAEFGTGQFLWSILWFSLFVMWVSLVISVFGDIIRSREMSGWAKGTWAVGIVFMPFLGVLLYLVINGNSMGGRIRDTNEASAHPYGGSGAGRSDSLADELSTLATLHESGALTSYEYEQAKAHTVRG